MPKPPVVLAMVAVALSFSGCGQTAKELSAPPYLFQRLRDHWTAAKAELQRDKPDFGFVAAVQVDMSGPMWRRIDQEYTGPNKAEILKRHAALSATFESTISPMLSSTGYAIVLRPGYTKEQARDAFMKLDGDFEAMMKLAK